MFDSIKSTASKYSKKISKILGCDYVKKLLSIISPATQFLYSLVLVCFLKEFHKEGSYLWYFALTFAGFSLLNTAYEIISEKRSFEIHRRFILNIFYFLSTCILAYLLTNEYIWDMFKNHSVFFSDIKNWVLNDRSFLGKIGAVFKIVSVLGSIGSMIYKYISKYRETPDCSEINVYRSINTDSLHRQNNEYSRVDVCKAIVLPLISIIVNLFTTNSSTGYIFAIASILQSFEITFLDKKATHMLPMCLAILSATIVGFKFFGLICPNLLGPVVI